MKRFKHYLEEKAPAWTKDVKKFIFDTHVMLPISSTIYKRVFENDPPRDRVQHLLTTIPSEESDTPYVHQGVGDAWRSCFSLRATDSHSPVPTRR